MDVDASIERELRTLASAPMSLEKGDMASMADNLAPKLIATEARPAGMPEAAEAMELAPSTSPGLASQEMIRAAQDHCLSEVTKAKARQRI